VLGVGLGPGVLLGGPVDFSVDKLLLVVELLVRVRILDGNGLVFEFFTLDCFNVLGFTGFVHQGVGIGVGQIHVGLVEEVGVVFAGGGGPKVEHSALLLEAVPEYPPARVLFVVDGCKLLLLLLVECLVTDFVGAHFGVDLRVACFASHVDGVGEPVVLTPSHVGGQIEQTQGQTLLVTLYHEFVAFAGVSLSL